VGAAVTNTLCRRSPARIDPRTKSVPRI
jgi:hypothetical protein